MITPYLDIKKQVHELATSVYQIRGHIKGKTLLPFPEGAKHIDEEERKAKASAGKECDIQLKNAIEGIIIKWAYQVDEVLSKDSSEEIADDKHPGPMTEINFWEAKCINLESLFEQVPSSQLSSAVRAYFYFRCIQTSPSRWRVSST